MDAPYSKRGDNCAPGAAAIPTGTAAAPIFFASAAELRGWFAAHHVDAPELHLGYYKRGTGEPSVSWPESVDEALCVGWIDGVTRRLDERRYTKRFTPRRAQSIWSVVNIRRMELLAAEGRVRPAGWRAFTLRREDRSAIYAYEQPPTALAEPEAGLLRADPAAATFFDAQSATYRQKVAWWLQGAKRPETRARRLAELIAASAAGLPVARFAIERKTPGQSPRDRPGVV